MGGTKWVDVWLKLRPGNPGFTYNGKENGMLTNYLKNRVDRVFFKSGQTLEPTSIKMVGRQQIDGVFYKKLRKKKGKQYEETLPVYPSDHFGLISTWKFAD